MVDKNKTKQYFTFVSFLGIAMNNKQRLTAKRFAVDTRPFCVWDWNLEDKNKRFVENVDESYFDYLADVFSKDIENENMRPLHKGEAGRSPLFSP